MIKYFAMIAAVVGVLATVDVAEARGRGCSSCGGGSYGVNYGYGYGGCPGGVCGIPASPTYGYPPAYYPAPQKMVVAPQPVRQAAPVVRAAPAAPRYYYTNAYTDQNGRRVYYTRGR